MNEAIKLKTSYGEMLRIRIRVMMDLQHAMCFCAVFHGLMRTALPETWQRSISVHSEEIRELMLWKRFHNYGMDSLFRRVNTLSRAVLTGNERGAR
ncbi:MAG: hypothetical protein WCJ75_09780 [Desulfomonile sp.]